MEWIFLLIILAVVGVIVASMASAKRTEKPGDRGSASDGGGYSSGDSGTWVATSGADTASTEAHHSFSSHGIEGASHGGHDTGSADSSGDGGNGDSGGGDSGGDGGGGGGE